MDICHAGRIGKGVAVAVSCHRQGMNDWALVL